MYLETVNTLTIRQEYIPDPDCECEFCPSDHGPLVLNYLTEHTREGEEYFQVIAHPSCFLEFLHVEYITWLWKVEGK